VIEIRRLTIEDHPALVRVWAAAGLPTKPGGRDAPEAFAGQLRFPGSHFLGAFDGGELVGAVLANHEGRKGWINRLAVVPARQRQGIATRLLRAAEEALRGDGIQIVSLLAFEHNAASLGFFASQGYVLDESVRYLSKRDHPDV
jgi:ribosomal protein S18 acetylase RimI-like enzyme